MRATGEEDGKEVGGSAGGPGIRVPAAGDAGRDTKPLAQYRVTEFWDKVKKTGDTSAAGHLSACGIDELSLTVKDDARARQPLAALLGKIDLQINGERVGVSKVKNVVVAVFKVPDMDYLKEKVEGIITGYRDRYAELIRTMTEDQIEDMALDNVIDAINEAPMVEKTLEIECEWNKNVEQWVMTSNPLDSLGLDKVIKEFQAL